MKKRTDSILSAALMVAECAYKNAQEEHGLDAGFYSMQQAEVEGRKCLILSVVLSEREQPVEFRGFSKI